jgi:type I restriction enzyme S subunit
MNTTDRQRAIGNFRYGRVSTKEQLSDMSGTSDRQRIRNNVLGRFPLSSPDGGVTAALCKVIKLIQEAIAANHRTAITLASLRDTLLPRLISGQLRLPEALDDNLEQLTAT